MNRPDRLNALNNELASALNDALGRIGKDPSVNVVVITGAGRAFYTGDMIDAKAALALGLVNQVVPAAQLETAVKTLAQKIAQGPSLPIRAVKKALFASQEKELAQALDNEVREQVRCYLSDDCNEGIRAFFEKRPPKFQGK